VGSILLGLGVLGILGRAADVVSEHGSSAPQDCAKPDSTFEVATKGGASANCPDGKLEDSDYAVFRDGTTTLCFMLNFKQGQCYTASGEAKNPIFAATACDGSLPRFQVVKRIDGSSDEALCPAGTKAISYPVPARLYCLQPLKN
jgi:hypothetical protein